MKKAIFVFLLAAMALLSACGTHYLKHYDRYITQKPADYIFQIGEEVKIYADEEKELLFSVEIKNAVILSDKPFSMDTPYLPEPAQAVVQINYTIKKTEFASDVGFSGADFDCYDCQGNYCPTVTSNELPAEPVYSSYQCKYIAVPVKGEYVDIRIELNEDEKTYATIRAYYGVGEQELDPSNSQKLAGVLTVLAVSLIATFTIAVILHSKRKKLRRQLEELKTWKAHIDEPVPCCEPQPTHPQLYIPAPETEIQADPDTTEEGSDAL